MFRTDIPARSIWNVSHRKESAMTFALALALVLVLSSAYLFHQWYTGDMN